MLPDASSADSTDASARPASMLGEGLACRLEVPRALGIATLQVSTDFAVGQAELVGHRQLRCRRDRLAPRAHRLRGVPLEPGTPAIEGRVPRAREREDAGEGAQPAERLPRTGIDVARPLSGLPQVEVDLRRAGISEERPEIRGSLPRGEAHRLLGRCDGRLSLATALVDDRQHALRLHVQLVGQLGLVAPDLPQKRHRASGRLGLAEVPSAVRAHDEGLGLEASVVPGTGDPISSPESSAASRRLPWR